LAPLDLHSHGAADLQVPARRTDIELVVAADNLPLLLFDVPHAKIAAPELEACLLSLSRLNLDLMETTKLAHRLVGSSREFNVQLSNLSTSDLTGVGDVGADFDDDVPQVLTSTNSKITGGKLVGEELGLRCDVDVLAVVEGSVGETEAEFVTRGGVLLIEVLVVDVVALSVCDCRLLTDLSVRVVVGLVLGDGVDEPAGGVDVTEENVVDGVTRGLTKRSTVEDTSDVLVSDPLVKEARTDGVDDDDSVVAVVGDGADEATIFQLMHSSGQGVVLTGHPRHLPIRSYRLLHQPTR